MTLGALRAGLRVFEVPVPLAHCERDHRLRSELHKARQLRDVVRALAVRSFPTELVVLERRLRRVYFA